MAAGRRGWPRQRGFPIGCRVAGEEGGARAGSGRPHMKGGDEARASASRSVTRPPGALRGARRREGERPAASHRHREGRGGRPDPSWGSRKGGRSPQRGGSPPARGHGGRPPRGPVITSRRAPAVWGGSRGRVRRLSRGCWNPVVLSNRVPVTGFASRPRLAGVGRSVR